MVAKSPLKILDPVSNRSPRMLGRQAWGGAVVLVLAMLAMLLLWVQRPPATAPGPGGPPDGGRCATGTRWVARPSTEPSYNCGGYCVLTRVGDACPRGSRRVPGLRGCAVAYTARDPGSCFAPAQVGPRELPPEPPPGMTCPADTIYQPHTGACMPGTDVIVRDQCPPGFEVKRWTPRGWSCYALPQPTKRWAT